MDLRLHCSCAAYVPYSGTSSYLWIVGRIESKAHEDKFIIRDEYPEDSNFQIYKIESRRVSPFPSPDESYSVGERILALWHDKEANVCSTVFYEASITGMPAKGKLKVIYKGSHTEIESATFQVTRFPMDFESDYSEEETEQETEQEAQQEIEEPPAPSVSLQSEVKAQDLKFYERLEKRRIAEMFGQPNKWHDPDFEVLQDGDFTSLGGNVREVKQTQAKEGTPLLDLVEDEERARMRGGWGLSHVTGTGILTVPRVKGEEGRSILLSENVKCGRLSRILHDWTVPPK
jgi:hypothetical protein